MVSVVIYGIIAIALAAAAGYALLVFSSTTQQTTQVQENSIRLEQAVNALRASLLALDGTGTLFAPMGYNPGTTGSYTQLPVSLGAVSSSPWGTPFEYCPVSLVSTTGLTTTAQTVTGTGSTSYTANVYQGLQTSINNYVITTSGTPANLANAASYGYVAFIVSSLTAGSNPPDCSAITISSTGVAVTGGSVRGVTAGFPFNQRVIASTDRMEIYVGAGGSTYTGTGDNTGRDINNLTTLGNAVAMWQALQPRLTDIYLTNGLQFTVANGSGLVSDINADTTRPYGPQEAPTLNFIGGNGPGSGGAQATLDIEVPLNPTTPVTFANLAITDRSSSINGNFAAPLTFYNVNFTATSFLPIYTYGLTQLIGTSLTNVALYNWGGTVIIDPNGVARSFTNTAFNINNGRFYLKNDNVSITSTITTASQNNFIFTASTAEFDPNTLSITNNSGTGYAFMVQSNSSLFFNQATVSVSQAGVGQAFLVQDNSNLTFNGSSVSVNAASTSAGAFYTTRGSNLDIVNTPVTLSYAGNGWPVQIVVNSTMSLTNGSMSISDTGSSGFGVYALAGQIVSNGSTISVASSSTAHGVFLDSGSSFDGFGNGAITASGSTLYPLTVNLGSSVNMNGYAINTSNGSTCMLIYNDDNINENMTISKNTNANSGGTPGNPAYIPYYYTGTTALTQQSKDYTNSYGNYYNGTGFTSTSPTAIALTPTTTPTSVDPTTLVPMLNYINSHSYFNKRLTFSNFTCN